MALPVINDVPKYTLTVPSTGKKLEYRPFLVKEQKVLLMSLESEDEGMIVRAIRDTIAACVLSDININDLATFDVEYIFTQIRCKSAGETTDIGILCNECDKQNEIKVNLKNIVVGNVPTPPTVKLNETYSIKLRYPTYINMIESTEKNDMSITDLLFEMCIASLDSLNSEEEQFKFDDEESGEKIKFLDGLSNEQFKTILDFVQNIPKMSHTIEFDCVSCNSNNKQTLEGINDFFQ